MTVDGYVAGPNGEMDWTAQAWDNELIQYVTAITESIDCIVLGRKLAEGFIPHWANVAANSEHPEFTAGQKFTDTHKVVFTKTLEKSPWANTVLAKGDLVDEITTLKKQGGKDLIVYGGATFVSALIQQELIDELHLFINPTAIGSGMTIFRGPNYKNLNLVKSTSFTCGVVVLHYEPKRD